MDSVSLDHSLTRNVFYTQSTREFQPVSLDEILEILVRCETVEESIDVSRKEAERFAEETSKSRMVPSDASLPGIYYTDF